MPAARGSRGPRRGRGSCPKLLCAYRGCRSKRDVKNLGEAFSAPRDAVTESQCRPLQRLPPGTPSPDAKPRLCIASPVEPYELNLK